MIVPSDWRVGDPLFPNERLEETLFFAKLWGAIAALLVIYLIVAGHAGGALPLEVGRTVALPQHNVLFTTQERY